MIVPCPSCGSRNRVPATRLGDKARCASCKGDLLPMGRPAVVGSASEFDELVGQAALPVLVDFWAAWCGPCRASAPEVDKLAEERAGQLVVAKVDTEALPEVAGRFGIHTIPMFILFRGGNEAARVAGAMPRQKLAAAVGL